MAKVTSNEPGRCPLCGSSELDYRIMKHDDFIESVYDDDVEACCWEWKCCNCGASGFEEYKCVFDTHVAYSNIPGDYNTYDSKAAMARKAK